MTRAPIQTAAARAGGRLRIPVDFGPDDGGVVEFAFRPGIAVRDADVQDRINSASSAADRITLAVDYLAERIAPEQVDQFRQVIESGALDVAAVGDVLRAVMGVSAGMDPTPPPSSSPGSPAIGPSSTDGAPAEVSTPSP